MPAKVLFHKGIWFCCIGWPGTIVLSWVLDGLVVRQRQQTINELLDQNFVLSKSDFVGGDGKMNVFYLYSSRRATRSNGIGRKNRYITQIKTATQYWGVRCPPLKNSRHALVPMRTRRWVDMGLFFNVKTSGFEEWLKVDLILARSRTEGTLGCFLNGGNPFMLVGGGGLHLYEQWPSTFIHPEHW